MSRSRSSRRLMRPRSTGVTSGPGGVPEGFGGVAVETVREEWVVEDRWWTREPLRRRYFELVLSDGRDVVVFRDVGRQKWFVQRA